MNTYIEQQIAKAVSLNSPIVPINNAVVVVTNGPIRLASKNPDAAIGLCITTLQGASAKDIDTNLVPATVGGDNDNFTLTHTQRAVGLYARISGARNVFRRSAVNLKLYFSNSAITVNGTTKLVTAPATPNQTLTVYPEGDDCSFLILFTNDNGGVGQIASFDHSAVTLQTASGYNNGVGAGEFAMSTEIVTLRDFTNRESA